MRSELVKKSFAAIALFLMATPAITAYGQEKSGIPDNTVISQTKAAAVRRLLDLMGSAKLSKQMLNELFSMLKNSTSQVPPRVWDEINAEYNTDIESGKFMEMIVPIYGRAFSEDEIKELIKFYESPIGKKLSATLPQILNESMTVGAEWAGEIMRRIQKRLKDKGYSVSAD